MKKYLNFEMYQILCSKWKHITYFFRWLKNFRCYYNITAVSIITRFIKFNNIRIRIVHEKVSMQSDTAPWDWCTILIKPEKNALCKSLPQLITNSLTLFYIEHCCISVEFLEFNIHTVIYSQPFWDYYIFFLFDVFIMLKIFECCQMYSVICFCWF